MEQEGFKPVDEWEIDITKDTPTWIFADDFKDEGTSFEVTNAGLYMSPYGKQIPVLEISGVWRDKVGKFFISKWNLRFSEEVITAYGSNASKWFGKKITFKRQGKKLVVYPFDVKEELVE